METRITKLETAVVYIQRDISEMKIDIREIKKDIRSDFRLLFGAIIVVALGLSALFAKGFHWI